MSPRSFFIFSCLIYGFRPDKVRLERGHRLEKLLHVSLVKGSPFVTTEAAKSVMIAALETTIAEIATESHLRCIITTTSRSVCAQILATYRSVGLCEKKDDARKEPHREVLHKPVHPPVNQEFKTALPLPLPAKPPPVADYIVKVPQVPFATYERDYSDITRRYTHLYISPDFTKLVCCWAKV